MKSTIFKTLLVVMLSTLAYDMLPAEETFTVATAPVAITAMKVVPGHHRRHRHRIIWRRHHHRRHPWRF